jgi:hypothetical protein
MGGSGSALVLVPIPVVLGAVHLEAADVFVVFGEKGENISVKRGRTFGPISFLAPDL